MSLKTSGSVIQGRRILPVVLFTILRDPNLLHMFDDSLVGNSTTPISNATISTPNAIKDISSTTNTKSTAGKFRNSMVPISTMKTIGKYILWPMLTKSIAHTAPVMAIHFSADELKNLLHM